MYISSGFGRDRIRTTHNHMHKITYCTHAHIHTHTHTHTQTKPKYDGIVGVFFLYWADDCVHSSIRTKTKKKLFCCCCIKEGVYIYKYESLNLYLFFFFLFQPNIILTCFRSTWIYWLTQQTSKQKQTGHFSTNYYFFFNADI
jgi:hypothetical protein